MLGLIFDAVSNNTRSIVSTEAMMRILMGTIKGLKEKIVIGSAENTITSLKKESKEITEHANKAKRSGMMSAEDVKANLEASKVLQYMSQSIARNKPQNGEEAFKIIKQIFDTQNAALKKRAEVTKAYIDNSRFSLLFCLSIINEYSFFIYFTPFYPFVLFSKESNLDSIEDILLFIVVI